MLWKQRKGKREAPRLLLLRRRPLALLALAAACAAIFAAVNAPLAVTASAAARQLPIYCVQRDQKVCSISFDAAWGADNTQKILDVLQAYGVTCTFFVVGNWADQYPAQAKAIVDAGHELMNHSNAHDHYNSLTAEQIIADVNACSDKIESLTGVRPTLIRCPFGEYDDHVISAIRSLGLEPIQWDVETRARASKPCGARVFRPGRNQAHGLERMPFPMSYAPRKQRVQRARYVQCGVRFGWMQQDIGYPIGEDGGRIHVFVIEVHSLLS